MPIRISKERLEQIELTEYGLSGDIGGLPKTTYFTPDGRIIRALPNIHVNQAGQSRDANLDRGWLLSPPMTTKPFCRACDRWHDTQKEVEACIARQQQFIHQAGKQAERDNTDEIATLKGEVAELRALIQTLTGGNGNGALLQRDDTKPSGSPPDGAGS